MLSPKARTGANPLPYLGNKNVQWGRFDLTDVGEMDFSPDEFKKFHLEQNDLLVCEGGEVGRCAIWDGSIPKCCFQKALHRLRPLDNCISAEYMLEFMLWGSATGLFSSLTGQSTIAHLPAVKLKRLSVPLVGVDERNSYLLQVSHFRIALASIAEQRKNTEHLRAKLIDVLMGEPL